MVLSGELSITKAGEDEALALPAPNPVSRLVPRRLAVAITPHRLHIVDRYT
jgi:hypothetical protein